jgi:hypothetical protein
MTMTMTFATRARPRVRARTRIRGGRPTSAVPGARFHVPDDFPTHQHADAATAIAALLSAETADIVAPHDCNSANAPPAGTRPP